MVASLGATIKMPNGKDLAALIVPTAYIPPTFPCPALAANNLCGIHANKPLRCRTMPFYPYREEQYQAETLSPRAGWACNTTPTAPVVFSHKKVVWREDFDRELAALRTQVPTMRTYATYMLRYTPLITGSLAKASIDRKGGQVITSLSSFLTATRNPDAQGIAEQQLSVLNMYIEKTAESKELAEYHLQYTRWAKEMSFLASTQTR
ncbi:MAG: hypothetical protein H6R01_26 [Burkholderiaceae bacterium]|nr:hypothetical protein [Burkholderiaceae bacterium]